MTAARADQDIWVGDYFRPGITVTTNKPYDSPVFTITGRSAPHDSYSSTPFGSGTQWSMALHFFVHGIAAPGLYDVQVCEDAGCPEPDHVATLHVVAGAPVVTELSRTAVAPGASVEASLFGYGLAHHAAVSFGSDDVTFSGDTEPIAEFVSDVQQTTLTGTLTVAATAHGKYSLTVTNTDGQTFTLPDAVTVEPGATDPNITVTPSTFQAGATSRVVWHSPAIAPGATLAIDDNGMSWIPDPRGGASSTLHQISQRASQDATVTNGGETATCSGCVHVEPLPAAPTILRETSSGGDLSVTWDASPLADAYLLGADATTPQTWTEIATTATTATLHGFEPASTHEVYVIAVSSAGRSDSSHGTSIPIAPANATYSFPPTLTNPTTYARGSAVVVTGYWLPGHHGWMALHEEGTTSPAPTYRGFNVGDDGSFSFALSGAVDTDFRFDDDGGGTVTGSTHLVGTTINVQAVSAPGRSTPVGGLAKPGSSVSVLDHGTPIVSALTRADGTWSTTLMPGAADLSLVARTEEADSPPATVRVAPITINGPAFARRGSTVTVTGTALPGTVILPMVELPRTFSSVTRRATQTITPASPIVTPPNGHWSFSYRAVATSRYFVMAAGVASRVVTTRVTLPRFPWRIP